MKAELVLLNGKIYSIKENDERVYGTAVAVADGLIQKIGTDEEMAAYISDDTQVIDCHGNSILPGLCDAHCHPSYASSTHVGCDLFGVYKEDDQSEDEVIDIYMERLKDFIEANPDNELYRGTGWVSSNFQGSRIPTRHDIDKICADKPVILESFCQHNLWVNTKAIEIAGVGENPPEIYAGEIVKEENGYPSGWFKEPEAMDYIKLNVPGYDYTVEKYKEAILWYQKECANKYGVTFVQDCMHSDNAKQAYKELADEGKLTLRMRGVYMLEPAHFAEQLPEYIERKGTDDSGEDFRINTIKIFSEGMFVLNEPYEEKFLKDNDMPEGYKGIPYWEDEELISSCKGAMEAGFDVHIHAMGDGSVKQSARCLAAAKKASGTDSRNVIAHLMILDEEDSQTMADADIIANCQPRWMVHDGDIDAMYYMMGEERAKKAYPYRTFLDKGVRVAFGTDFPVTPPPDTMHEIHCCMNREVFPDVVEYEKFKGKVLGTEKKATLAEAVKSLSLNGAYQMRGESYTGSIEEGKSAELVILNADIEATPVSEIYAIKIDKTIFKGKVVYEA